MTPACTENSTNIDSKMVLTNKVFNDSSSLSVERCGGLQGIPQVKFLTTWVKNPQLRPLTLRETVMGANEQTRRTPTPIVPHTGDIRTYE
jgi:hypothetical protein